MLERPGMPLGIFEKSPRPNCLPPSPALVEAERAVGRWTPRTGPLVRSPCHSDAWFSLGRSGGDATNFAPSKPVRAKSSMDR